MEEEVKFVEENKEVEVKQEKENNVEQNQEKEIKLQPAMLYMLLGALALVILVIAKIVWNFRVYGDALHGITAIVVYCLPLAGALLSGLQYKKHSCALYVNLAVLALALICY